MKPSGGPAGMPKPPSMGAPAGPSAPMMEGGQPGQARKQLVDALKVVRKIAGQQGLDFDELIQESSQQ